MEPDQARPDSGDSILAAHHARIMYLMSYVVAVFVTPFAINNFVQGQIALGVTVLAVVAGFVLNGFWIRFRKQPLIPFVVLLLPVAAAIFGSLSLQGIYGAFWCYPAVLMCYFVLSRRTAVAASLMMTGIATAIIGEKIGPDLAVRFAISLMLTMVVIYIINNVIRHLQDELMSQIITDPLTGAFNRRHMESVLSDAIERFRRTGAPASVLLIDIDHFKRVNDQRGHYVGDAVLKDLVDLVQTRSRKLDRLFRMGGEEFLVYLPDTHAAAASTHAEHLRVSVAESQLIDGAKVTISIGVAEYAAGQTVDSWIKRADDALYRAKNEGRDRVVTAPQSPPGLHEVEVVDRRARQR